MERYVDGYVLPVPSENIEEYRELAAEAGRMWIDHGALAYFEGVGDDLTPELGEEAMLTFPEIVDPGPDETVVFAYVVYRSRAHRDEVNDAVMSEMDDAEEVSMPFDVERMAYGGFRSLVSLEG